MNAISMLQTASILLLLTSLGGLVMAAIRFARKANPPSWIAMAHGFLAASGVTLLVYAGLTDRVHGAAMFGLVLLLAASVGGVIMNLGYHLAGKILPAWLLMVHIGLAAIGTLLVALSAWAD
jgi:drug/metabolite transporter (DMT)-like permease